MHAYPNTAFTNCTTIFTLMKKRFFFLSILIFILLLIYLLWPLSSDRWDIQFNRTELAKKINFLEKEQGSTSDSLPNILLIVVDDLGMADLSLYGGGHPATPHIDALGSAGVVFNNAYVTSPICSPSRAAMLSGRYQQRFGFQYQLHDRYLRNRLEYLGFNYFVDSYPWIPKWMDEVPGKKSIDKQGFPPSEIILPELLKTKGYQTAMIGKWHLGSDEAQIPCAMGFDYQYGFYASHSLYAYENTPGIHDQKIKDDFTDPHIWSGQRKGPHAIYKNCEEIEVTEYLTDRFADEAIHYINKHDSDPFFLYLAFNAPHTPLQAPEMYMEKFNTIKDPIKRTYYAMIANLDDNIGKVMDALGKRGLDESTLVFFISDNGGAEYTHTTNNGKYKGGKITDFEGGLKVPFIIRWKNKLNHQTYEHMVSSMDIFQTIVALADINLPDDRTYDGVNLLPFLLDENTSEPHPYLFWQRGFSKAIRSKEWKMVLNEASQDTTLFYILDDPFETDNISIEHPDIARQLALTHKNWSSTLPPPLWPSMIYYEFNDGNHLYYFDQ